MKPEFPKVQNNIANKPVSICVPYPRPPLRRSCVTQAIKKKRKERENEKEQRRKNKERENDFTSRNIFHTDKDISRTFHQWNASLF